MAKMRTSTPLKKKVEKTPLKMNRTSTPRATAQAKRTVSKSKNSRLLDI